MITGQIINDLLGPAIEAAFTRKATNHSSDDNSTYIDHLITMTSDKQEIRDQLVTFLLAARDTTAAFLSSALHQLAICPRIKERLCEEISRLDKETKLSYDDLKGLKFLRAFINETMR